MSCGPDKAQNDPVHEVAHFCTCSWYGVTEKALLTSEEAKNRSVHLERGWAMHISTHKGALRQLAPRLRHAMTAMMSPFHSHP